MQTELTVSHPTMQNTAKPATQQSVEKKCINFTKCGNNAQFRECNSCKKQRARDLEDPDINLCSGCYKPLTSDDHATCEKCRNRGQKNRKKCMTCKEPAYLNKYCKVHYDSLRSIRNEMYEVAKAKLEASIQESNTDVADLNENLEDFAESDDNVLEDEENITQSKPNEYDIFSTDMLNSSYVGGLFDGDGSLGIIAIGKNKAHYQMIIQFSQSVTNILYLLQQKYGGYVYKGRKRGTQRQQYCYRISGRFSQKLLNDLNNGCIIKHHQAVNCSNFIPLIDKHNPVEKQKLHANNRALNHNTLNPEKPMYKMDNSYIAGLFDAEGCFLINVKSDRPIQSAALALQISQKTHPDILDEIQEYLGYGTVNSERTKWVVENQNDIQQFLKVIEGKIIVKEYQFRYYKLFLENRIKYFRKKVPEEQIQLYKEWRELISKDKHEDRNTENDESNSLVDDSNSNASADDNSSSSSDNNSSSSNPRRKTIILAKPLKLPLKTDFNKPAKQILNLEKKPVVYKRGEEHHSTGVKFDDEHRMKISLAKSGVNTGLTKEQFSEVRTLLKDGKTKVFIADRLKCDRNLVTKIEAGLLHADERDDLSAEKLKEYYNTYIKKHSENKALRKELSPQMTNSINKRIVKDLDTLIDILLYKFKVNHVTKKLYTSKYVCEHYSRIEDYKRITEEVVKNLWSGKSKFYEEEFSNSSITFERFNNLCAQKRDLKQTSDNTDDIPELINIADI